MKKIITLLLIVLLAFSGCVSRVEQPVEPEVPEEEIVTEDPQEEPPKEIEHVIEDSEEISQVISVVAGLLKKADDCGLLYTGKFAVVESEQQIMEDVTYTLTDSKFLSIEGIEDQWLSTFTPDGKAKKFYDEMIEDMRYVSINGQLYVKEYDSDLPPMTMGQWDLDTIELTEVTEEKILVKMNTTLVGQENGIKELEIINMDDVWLLTDSYFID